MTKARYRMHGLAAVQFRIARLRCTVRIGLVVMTTSARHAVVVVAVVVVTKARVAIRVSAVGEHSERSAASSHVLSCELTARQLLSLLDWKQTLPWVDMGADGF